MRLLPLHLMGAVCFCTSIASATAAQASSISNGQPRSPLSAQLGTQLLTGERSSATTLSAATLLGGSPHRPLRPQTAKAWSPTPVSTRSVSAFWSLSRQSTQLASSPAQTDPNARPADSPSPGSPSPGATSGSLASGTNETLPTIESRGPTAQSLPTLEEVQQIQRALRGLDFSAGLVANRSVYPGITISNPSGYGADGGQVYAGIGFQSRTRFSGGNVFGGGSRDGTAGIGFGLGDARRNVGLQLSYTAASFGGSRARFSGGFNAKLHKQFGDRWAAAIGGEGIINIGRLPEDDDEIEFNDFENTYYGVISKTLSLRKDFSDPFSRLTLTGGAGTGRFRSVDQIANGEFAVGAFGSAALQVLPSTTLITEWTGQDLAVGVSVAPFPNFPLVITPAIRDLAGEGDGTPRFVLGIGVSLSDVLSRLGL